MDLGAGQARTRVARCARYPSRGSTPDGEQGMGHGVHPSILDIPCPRCTLPWSCVCPALGFPLPSLALRRTEGPSGLAWSPRAFLWPSRAFPGAAARTVPCPGLGQFRSELPARWLEGIGCELRSHQGNSLRSLPLQVYDFVNDRVRSDIHSW